MSVKPRLPGRARTWLVALAGTAGVLASLVGALRWWFAIVTVHGPSMAPALADGDRLLAWRCPARSLRTGSLVIFLEPGLPSNGSRPMWLTGASQKLWVVKRVAATPGESVPEEVRQAVNGVLVVPPRSIVVLGDSPHSRDSRHWGFIPFALIFGKAVRRLSRPQ
jgi:signal peptidase I